jgi:hypothetical protein
LLLQGNELLVDDLMAVGAGGRVEEESMDHGARLGYLLLQVLAPCWLTGE